MRTGFATLAILLLCTPAHAQLERQRADPGAPVEAVFWAPTMVGTSTVSILPRGSLDFTIMHSFGIVTDGIEELFGLDGVANIRFGLDYSATDRVAIGLGRSRFDKTYDGRMKVAALRQRRDGSIPVEVALQGGVAITTAEYDAGLAVDDRLSYMLSLMVARRMSDRLSIQVAPLFTHRNTVFRERLSDDTTVTGNHEHLAVAFVLQAEVIPQVSIGLEYVPVLSKRTPGTEDAFSVVVQLDTGGHVFQLFVSSVQWFTPQQLVSRTEDAFFSGDFRFGFNVHRVFSL